MVNASTFTWSPTGSLTGSGTLTPTAGPLSTTSYVLSAFYNTGCPKPFRDTVVVSVLPRIFAFAGNDTSAVIGQTLQLNASGGASYLWSPATTTGFNTPNPTLTFSSEVDLVTYRVRVSDAAGCFADDDINIKVFKGPDIFIPTGFTPNNDRKNDILKPILVGLKSLTYFKVYNRWGQLLFTTSQDGAGWDGSFGGRDLASGTYIFIAEAVDFLGKAIVKKGTVVLIR
jgi:gliding motility-associated-like protein